MAYVKTNIPSVVYHLTKKESAANIILERTVRRFDDRECWFCRSLLDMKRYMEYTVLCEGKAYIGTGGTVEYYPKFVPEDYVVLKLTPQSREKNWYKWMLELPHGSSEKLKCEASEFSNLKIGYRGNLRFSKYEIIKIGDILMNEYEKLRRISERLRENYPMGTRIILLEMNDPQAVPSGTKGTVIAVDDMANIHMKWDNGRTLSLAGDVDKFRKLTEEELSNEKICTVKGEMTHI